MMEREKSLKAILVYKKKLNFYIFLNSIISKIWRVKINWSIVCSWNFYTWIYFTIMIDIEGHVSSSVTFFIVSMQLFIQKKLKIN